MIWFVNLIYLDWSLFEQEHFRAILREKDMKK